MGQLVKVALVHALLTQKLEVAKDSRHHLITVRQPFVGQRCRYRQYAAVAVNDRIGVGADPFHKPLLLQPVRERARAAVANQVGNQLVSFAAELRRIVIDAELNPHHLARHHRHIVEDQPLLRIGHHRHVNFRQIQRFVRHAAKSFCRNGG